MQSAVVAQEGTDRSPTGSSEGEAAFEALVDAVVRQQLPDDATESEVENVRAEVAELLKGDPTIAALLRR